MGRDAAGRDHLIEQAGSLALRVGRYKLIEGSKRPPYDRWTRTELGHAPEPRLYDVVLDPGERHDLAASMPDLASRMAERLRALKRSGRTREP